MTDALREVNWRRMLWVAIFTFFLFNTGGLKACNPPPCHPLVPASCEP